MGIGDIFNRDIIVWLKEYKGIKFMFWSVDKNFPILSDNPQLN